MTACTRCGSSRFVALSTYAGERAERLCVADRAEAAREFLARQCDRAGRWHTASALRGVRCPGACGACDALRGGA